MLGTLKSPERISLVEGDIKPHILSFTEESTYVELIGGLYTAPTTSVQFVKKKDTLSHSDST